MNDKTTVTCAMSNRELADAITVAYGRAGTATEDQLIQQRHMERLLAIQEHRASMFIITADERAQEHHAP